MSSWVWYNFISVQIIAESLPISSSGHLALLALLLNRSLCDVVVLSSGQNSWLLQQLSVRTIDYFLHGPTCIIVALFFYNRWIIFLTQWHRTIHIAMTLLWYVVIADSITLAWFLLLRSISFYFPLGFGFFITACALASLQWCKEQQQSLTSSKMIILGIVQSIALLPGISRFGSTYVAARWLGLAPRKALEISWLIQMPLMGASFLYSLIVFWQLGIPDQVLNIGTALVMMGASIGGWYALRIAAYASNHNRMWWFACYLIIPFMLWALFK